MTTPSRRTLLKGLAAGLLPMPGITRLAFADEAAADAPILVLIHQRGACDGLHLISPATDPDFIAARITELRVAADGKDAGFALANGPAPGIDFRLHNAAGGLADLYKGGNLAFIHACGLTNATRSHFVASDMIERGVASDADLARATSGWLARALEARHASGLAAATAGGAVDGDLLGFGSALAVPDLGGGLQVAGGAPVGQALAALYADGGSGLVAEAGRTALTSMASLDTRVPRDPKGHVIAYPNTAAYDPAGNFGRTMKTAAQLIKMEVGLRALTVDFGEWDTHEYQAPRFRSAVDRLSRAIAAFWNDMSAYHNRLTVVMITEFGRRLRNNKSGGTDHGRGGVTAVLGGAVRGGRFYGAWPGLKTEQLDEGVDLAVTTDYRQVLTEVLIHQNDKPDIHVFPGYKTPATPLGLFA